MIADPFTCPGCRSKLRRDPALPPGTPVRCPRCGRDFALPAAVTLAPRLPPPMLVPPARQAPPPGQNDPTWRYDSRPADSRGLEGLDGGSYRVAVGRWLREANWHWKDMVKVLGVHVLLCAALAGILVSLMPRFGVIAAAVLALPLAHGPMAIALAMVERRHWHFHELLAGFAGLPAFLGFYGLLGILSVWCFVPLYGVTDWLQLQPVSRVPEGGVRAALRLGAGLVSLALLAAVHARLATFGPQLILDRGCGPMAAFEGSWRLSRGHFWGLWRFTLLRWAMNLVGLLLCYVGLLLTLPLTQLAAAAAYLDAVGRLAGPAPTRREDEELC